MGDAMAENKKNVKYKTVVKKKGGDAAGPVYFLGFIGAAVYYVQIANGFGEVLIALLKAIVWPAYLVWELLRFLNA